MINKGMQQMTEKQVRQAASQAIANTLIEPWRYYHLCWWEGRLQCLHVHHMKDPHPTFYAANGHVFTKGLNVFQWRLATSRIMDFCQREGITLGDSVEGRIRIDGMLYPPEAAGDSHR